jgi:hypothetical protein
MKEENKMNNNNNFNTTFCKGKDCEQLVYKGDGVYHNFDGGFTLCLKCNENRDKSLARKKAIKENIKKAEIKKAYLATIPTLFSEEG